MTADFAPGGAQVLAERVLHVSEDVRDQVFAAQAVLMVQAATAERTEHPFATRLAAVGKEAALDAAALAVTAIGGTSRIVYEGLEHRRKSAHWKALGLTPAQIRTNHLQARLAKKSNANFL
jgi:hypothetical protein